MRRMVRLFSLPPKDTGIQLLRGARGARWTTAAIPRATDPMALLWAGLREHAESSTHDGAARSPCSATRRCASSASATVGALRARRRRGGCSSSTSRRSRRRRRTARDARVARDGAALHLRAGDHEASSRSALRALRVGPSAARTCGRASLPGPPPVGSITAVAKMAACVRTCIVRGSSRAVDMPGDGERVLVARTGARRAGKAPDAKPDSTRRGRRAADGARGPARFGSRVVREADPSRRRRRPATAACRPIEAGSARRAVTTLKSASSPPPPPVAGASRRRPSG